MISGTSGFFSTGGFGVTGLLFCGTANCFKKSSPSSSIDTGLLISGTSGFFSTGGFGAAGFLFCGTANCFKKSSPPISAITGFFIGSATGGFGVGGTANCFMISSFSDFGAEIGFISGTVLISEIPEGLLKSFTGGFTVLTGCCG